MKNICCFSEKYALILGISAGAPGPARPETGTVPGWAGPVETYPPRPHSRFGCAVGGDVGVGKHIETNDLFIDFFALYEKNAA